MKLFTLCVGLTALVAGPAYSEDVSVADWYKNSYGVLWEENPWDNVDAAASFYAEVLHVHSTEGPTTVDDSREWLALAIAGWKADGWLGSKVTALQVDRLNPSTVVFKSKWRDRYADGLEEFSRGWYLADLKDDRWRFTQYADIDCAEHDL